MSTSTYVLKVRVVRFSKAVNLSVDLVRAKMRYLDWERRQLTLTACIRVGETYSTKAFANDILQRLGENVEREWKNNVKRSPKLGQLKGAGRKSEFYDRKRVVKNQHLMELLANALLDGCCAICKDHNFVTQHKQHPFFQANAKEENLVCEIMWARTDV